MSLLAHLGHILQVVVKVLFLFSFREVLKQRSCTILLQNQTEKEYTAQSISQGAPSELVWSAFVQHWRPFACTRESKKGK